MEAAFDQAPIGNELRSRIVAFGATGSLSARLNERQADTKVIVDLDADMLDLTDVGAESS